MKVLYIGKKGNMQRYSEPESLAKIELIEVSSADEIPAGAGDAQVLVVDAINEVSAGLIDSLPSLKLIHSEGVAYNKIDSAYAAKKGIYTACCKGMNSGAVAEQAILLMLGCLRNVSVNDAEVRAGRQIEVKTGYMAAGSLKELADMTVGLLGFGDIARKTAALLNAFHVKKIYYHDLFRADEEVEAALNAEFRETDELLEKSDIVSIHVPVTKDTENMADDAFFAKMKDGTVFINTARGELVDEAALVRALENRKLAMAGLDTVTGEPVARDHFLLCQKREVAQRLLFSPHIGGITASSFRRGYAMIHEAIEDIKEGRKPKRTVNM